MPFNIGDKEYECGYFGTKEIDSALFGEKLVCAVLFPKYPTVNALDKRVIIDYRAGNNPYSTEDFVRSADFPHHEDWRELHMNNPSVPNVEWERLTCDWRMVYITVSHNLSRVTDISVYKAAEYADNVAKPLKILNMFNSLPNIETIQFQDVTTSCVDFTHGIADCPKLKYVGFRPQNFNDKISLKNSFVNLPSLKIITYINSTGPVVDRSPIFDAVTAASLVRPSSFEQSILNRSWGGLFNYNALNGKSGIQYDCPKGRMFSLENMSFKSGESGNALAISEIEVIDNHGNQIIPDGIKTSSDLASYPASNVLDGNQDTFWHNDYSVVADSTKVSIAVQFNDPVSVSQIIVRAREGSTSLRTFLKTDIVVYENYDGSDSGRKVNTWYGNDWASKECRSILLTNFVGW